MYIFVKLEPRRSIMKKIIALILTMLLALSLFACVAEEETDSSIDDYAAPNYTHRLTAEQGGGTVTFKDGHAESAVISDYTGPSKLHTVIIPEKISEADREVSAIGERAFYQTPTIKEVILPDTVTSIGAMAFAGCTALERIEIPASVTTIDEYAFYGCSSLKTIIFKGEELKSIGDFAFLRCEALAEIELPEGLESIGKQTFGYCKSITNLTTPSTLTTIGELAFYGCEGLNADGALTLSASITEIGEAAFGSPAIVDGYQFEFNKYFINAPEGSFAAKYIAENVSEPSAEE